MKTIFFEKSTPRVIATLMLKKMWGGAIFAPTAPVRVKELPEPALRGKRSVRLKNRLCGICASDLHLVYVDIDPMVHPAALPGQPRIYLGHEVVSEVVEVGEDCQTLKVGDRVVMKSRFLGPQCEGMGISPACRHCEAGNYALCENHAEAVDDGCVGGGWSDTYTCHESEIWKAPEGLDDDAATLLEPLACGVRAVLRRVPAAGEKVLVLGCGTIGLATIQALRVAAPEAEVYAVARYPQQIELAQRYGAKIVEQRDLLEAASAITGARVYTGDFNNRTTLGGFDVIFDCVGSATTVNTSLRICRAGGAVVVEGVYLYRMKLDMTPVWHQEVDLIGTLAHGMEEWEGEQIDTFSLTARWLMEGKLLTEGLITHRFPLSEWKKGIQTATSKKTGCIKVVFDCQG